MKTIFITPGDRDGIGPEVGAKALGELGFLNLAKKNRCHIVWVGPSYAGLSAHKNLDVILPPVFKDKSHDVRVGKECG